MFENISSLVFLFIAFVVMSSGFVTQILSCQVQHVLETNIYMKHVIGYILIYVFIMLEGGWSFNKEVDKKYDQNNWSNGNSFDSLIYALGLYVVFMVSAKMQFYPNILFYFMLFLIYVLNTQRLYWVNRNMLTKTQDKIFKYVLLSLLVFTMCMFVYGIYDYSQYTRIKHGDNFNWVTFFVGKPQCQRVVLERSFSNEMKS